MYIPKHFQQNEKAAILELIRSFPLATIVAMGSKGLFANHIPLLLADDGSESFILQGHIAKANEMADDLKDNSEVLAIFQGGDSYISPGWYPSKKQNPKVVPTWNYIAVHITGVIRFIHDRNWKKSFLNTLTDSHESGRALPWKMADAPEDYLGSMMDGIIGIEIIPRVIQAKWKLSQNQTLENRLGVIEGLENLGHDSASALAGEIKKNS